MQYPVLIRKALPADYDTLRRIYYQSRMDNFIWESPEQIKIDDFDTATEGELIFVASINEKIAGFISIWVQDKFIHSLFVASELKGRGVGKALIRQATETVGLPLTLKCVKANTYAMQFYLSQGWTIEAEACDSHPYYHMKYTGSDMA